MTMYTGEDARREMEDLMQDHATRIDPHTGHRIVHVRSVEEATALLESLRREKESLDGKS